MFFGLAVIELWQDIPAAIKAVFGGTGLVACVKWLFDWWLRWSKQEQDANEATIRTQQASYEWLSDQYKELCQRVDKLEEAVRREETLRHRAEMENAHLKVLVERLIHMINELRSELGMDPIRRADLNLPEPLNLPRVDPLKDADESND